MKKKLLLILPISMILCGCKFSIFGKTFTFFEKKSAPESEQKDTKPSNDQQVINDVEPEDPTKHATNMSMTPNAPFYLKVGETKDISVSLSPAPTLTSEKTIAWSLKGEYITYVVQENTYKVKITGTNPGTSYLTATNTYNQNLTKTFTIKVIDFDEENNYLWQYASSDRAQFGYDNTEAKMGTLEGDAVLNGMTWHYTRSNLTSLQSSMGAVGFGKGQAPETHVHLETTVDRLVNKFTLEAGSAHSQGRMTIKIGDTVYMNNKVLPKDDYDVIPTIESDPVLPTYGKIEIDVYTPEYDESRADDPTYQKPGAFYLKSIWINYKEEVIDRIQLAADSEHKVDYYKGENFTLDGLKIQKHTERDVLIDVDIDKEEELGNFTYVVEDFNTASHIAKDVRLSLRVDGYDDPFELTIQVHVRDESWVPSGIEILGEVEHQLLIEGDEVDYSNISIRVIYDEDTEDYMYCKFEESEIFSFRYGSEGDPFVAEKVMENGYQIAATGYFVPVDGIRTQTVTGYLTVPAGTLSITEAIFDRIDFRRSTTYQKLVEAGLNTTSKPLSYTYEKTNRVRIDFDKVSKGNRLSDHKELPKTLSDFHITILDTNLSVDKLNIEFAKMSSKDNNYRLFSSIYGGDIYGDLLANAKNHKIIHEDFEEHTNNLLLAPGLTSTGSTVNANTGIASILIRYVETPHVTYSLSTGDTAPTKLVYQEGETFDPTGLVVSLTETGKDESIDVTQYVKWYDGSSFNDEPQETLLPASTYVVGVFHEKTFNIDIERVDPVAIHVTLVTDPSEFTTDGRYYITCPSTRLVLLGSSANGDVFTAKGCSQEEELTFGNEMNMNILLEDDYVTITPLENGKFTINTAKGFFSITNSGNATCSNTAANYREFSITIDEYGIVHAEIFRDDGNGEGPKFYLGCNESSKVIKLYSTDKANIAIYKVA